LTLTSVHKRGSRPELNKTLTQVLLLLRET
jgi:hypothetical protein